MFLLGGDLLGAVRQWHLFTGAERGGLTSSQDSIFVATFFVGIGHSAISNRMDVLIAWIRRLLIVITSVIAVSDPRRDAAVGHNFTILY